MRSFPIFGLALTIFFLSQPSGAARQDQIIDDYRNGLDRWQSKSFSGHTRYTVESEDGRYSIKADSSAAASGLFYKIDYDPKEKPLLKWSWKIKGVISKGDARTKEGDDYAARVYVVFPSPFFWKTRALNYIWANKLPKGTAVANPFTANAMMIAVESGNSLAGTWQQVERDIYRDYTKYFGSKPPKVGAIAIMTDTDNTGERALAWYGPISIGKQL